ncbi:MAG: Clp1/GlmU family protein [Candidatus Binatia bacterium]
MTTLDIPQSWEHSAEVIRTSRWRTILVLGGADRGKSTYCVFLARRLGTARHRVALVDADVGQKDIGPPTTITLGYFTASRAQAPVRPSAYYFVGSTTPSGHLVPMVVGAKRMLDAAQADSVLVNTTGFIHGVGRVLKTHKIEALRPDVIVAIQAGDELESILRAHRNQHIIRIALSSLAVRKSADERRRNREEAFGRYFRQATQVSLPLAKVIFQRSLLLTSEAIPDASSIYTERTPEGVIAVSDDRPRTSVLKVLPPGFERHLLCGVADQHDEGLGLATIQRIDFKRGTICLITPVPRSRIAILQLGDMYVTSEGEELAGESPLRV